VQNFQILIVSVVKTSKQCLPIASASGGLTTGADPNERLPSSGPRGL